VCISIPNFIEVSKINQTIFEIRDFFDFQNGYRLQTWSFKVSKFYLLMGSRGPKCIIVLNFGKIG